MIDRHNLLSDLQKVLRTIEKDLLERTDSPEVPEIKVALRAEYDRALQAERTAQSYEEWKSDTVTQTAAAWVLSCVFMRFLEDNQLIDPPKIAGRPERLQRARDEHELYFRVHPHETDRDYLLAAFAELSKLPGTKEVFGAHNPVNELPNWLSGDYAGELLRFFQKIDANVGTLVHDFTDPTWDTRFLGDLYQDLSETARKKYALLQTPEFVEEFILDRTLDPALDEFGLDAEPAKDAEGKPVTQAGFRMLDPACGSGHFLLGAFRRILNRWLKQEPGAKIRDLVQRALNSVNGVDLNPYAVAIARFRLLLASMQACGVTRLTEAPAFHFNLACGDSLLHGILTQGFFSDWSPIAHHFYSEDIDALRRLLRPGQYHAVVANPPYIKPNDLAINQAYRARYDTCYKKYSLAVPFLERIFQLSIHAGFTGQITSNSFMKREFGRRLIERFLPKVDLTHIINTSGAYIPGHGTPTVILLARNRPPSTTVVRTVMAIRGEPSTPEDPLHGLVWSAIVSQVDVPGSESAFVSVSDLQRGLFSKHPWSVGGGGAVELKELLDAAASQRLQDAADSIGVMAVTAEDDAFTADQFSHRRNRIKPRNQIGFVEGDAIRDWALSDVATAVFPYSPTTLKPEIDEPINRQLWLLRTGLCRRLMFRKTQLERGLAWFEYGMFIQEKYRSPFLITFPFVATHNHFVLVPHGKVFKQTAPIIKLPDGTSEEEYVALVGLLNSSAACFWLQQVCHNKGRPGADAAAADEPWEFRFEYDSTKLKEFPLPKPRPTGLAMRLNTLASELERSRPVSVVAEWEFKESNHQKNLRLLIDHAHQSHDKIRGQLIALQEELDWHCYEAFGLIREGEILYENPPSLRLGERAFEIVLSRRCAAGEVQTEWFERLGAKIVTEVPVDWADAYQTIVRKRIDLIEADPQIGLLEEFQFKRRWQAEPWLSLLKRALKDWLLLRLESYTDLDGRMNSRSQPTSKLDIAITSAAKLADIARSDAQFLEVGELYRDDAAFDVHQLVAELIEVESVPMLPVLLFKDSGLATRCEWEKTWDLQRHEDAIDAQTKLAKEEPLLLTENQAREMKHQEVGEIPVPPKYTKADFLKDDYWRLRGKLDIPKERWVSFPHCEGPDGTLVIAWAGYDQLQLAKAVSTYYVDIQERFGGRDDPRLVPLLACVIELLPWIKQWHNDPNPDFDGMRMGDYFEGFAQEEARQMGKTIAEIKAWQPPQRARSRRTRGSASQR